MPDLLFNLLNAPLQSDNLLMNARLLALERGKLLLQSDVLGLLQIRLHSEFLLHSLDIGLEIPLDVAQLRLEAVAGVQILALDGFQLVLLHTDFLVLHLQREGEVLHFTLEPRRPPSVEGVAEARSLEVLHLCVFFVRSKTSSSFFLFSHCLRS